MGVFLRESGFIEQNEPHFKPLDFRRRIYLVRFKNI